jgi:hypothetical protein
MTTLEWVAIFSPFLLPLLSLADWKLSDRAAVRRLAQAERDNAARAAVGVPHSKCSCAECADWRRHNAHRLVRP